MVLGSVPVRQTAPPLLTFAMKPFRRRQWDSVRVAAALSWKEAAMSCASACGAGSDLRAKERLEANGRDDRVFISLSTVLATSVAKAFLFPFFAFPGPQPAACA